MTKDILNLVKEKEKIIIAGITCTGKSTLINELNEKEFPEIRNKNQMVKFLNGDEKFSTMFCLDTDEVSRKVKLYGINTDRVGLIFSNPDFTYSKIQIIGGKK